MNTQGVMDAEGALALFGEDAATEWRAAGEHIIIEGRPGDLMYVVRTGMVEVTANGQLLEMAQPGDVFGEIALIDGEPRSASAACVSDCELIPVDRAAFLALVARHPEFALYVMRSLAARLRRMNAAVPNFSGRA